MQHEFYNITGDQYLASGVDVFGQVIGIFKSKEERREAQTQADALISQGKSNVEVAKIMQETRRLELEAIKLGGDKNAKGSNILYIGLGVGAVVILGVVIFAVTRKKE